MAKLLLIDNDPMLARAYQRVFEKSGCELFSTAASVESLAAVASIAPDLLLLDSQPGETSAGEWLTRVRSLPGFETLPALVFWNPYLADSLDLEDERVKVVSKAGSTPEILVGSVLELLAKAGSGVAAVGAAGVTLEAESGSPSDPLKLLFAEVSPAIVGTLNSSWQAFVRTEAEQSGVAALRDLARVVHALSAHAAVAGYRAFAQVAAAFEALLWELTADPFSINPSSRRTMAGALDFLVQMSRSPEAAARADGMLQGLAFAVDDEATSLWAVGTALELAGMRPLTLDNPELALEVLKQNRFDLIFLDVDMPGRTGYDVCKVLRGFSTNQTTPVVFVTGLTDFSSRAKSTLSGGNDFIAKPFLLPELAVKALILLARSRIGVIGTKSSGG